MKFLFKSFVNLALIGLLIFAAYAWLVTRNLPDIDKMVREGVNPSKYTQVLAADGTPVYSYERFHHKDVPLAEVSPHFIDSLIATEDRRFFMHLGIDPIAIGRAMVINARKGGIREGGSTITQQLARNVFLSNERSINRKIREMALSVKLEHALSKEKLLELYVNNMHFGEGAYGISAASEIYFNKKPAQLSVDEAALLAGLPQAPSRYSPFQNKEYALSRRNEVLANLFETGKITKDELKALQDKPLRINPNGQSISRANRAPYFNQFVVDSVNEYLDLDEQSFWMSGLKIYTTLDIDAQKMAENAVASQSAAYGRTAPKQQAALVAIETNTGKILAYVGGKDYSRSQFDRVSQATRSPGSLFKVFTYTTAIDKGLDPTRVYLDEPIRLHEEGSPEWMPHNWDNKHHGYMTMARALIESNNVIAVKVLNTVGPDSVIETARRMGIKSPLNPYLALTLGGSGVTLLEITSAIGVLGNQGVLAEPYVIDKVMDNNGKIIYQHYPVKHDVLRRSTVDTMVGILTQVVQRGTGSAANIGRPMGGKTGTSDDSRDAWFVGFTPEIATGVWIGNDDNSSMGAIAGGSLPAVTWKTFMNGYLSGKPVSNFATGEGRALNGEEIYTYKLDNLSEDDVNSPLSAGVPVEPEEGVLDSGDGTPVLDEEGNATTPENNNPPVPDMHYPAPDVGPRAPATIPADPLQAPATQNNTRNNPQQRRGYPGVILNGKDESAKPQANSSRP